MATSADTFERKEKKYLITGAQCSTLKEALSRKMCIDDYGPTRIDSLYLDTSTRSLISRSLEKPTYKEKLRIRSYGAFSEAEVVYIEIKKKFKGIVYKRRVRMSAQGAVEYYSGKLTYEQAHALYPIGNDPSSDLMPGKVQIAREIDAFFRRYEGLKPSMLISCLREAWRPVDPSDANCVDRITFDENISYIDLFENESVQRRSVAGPGQVVMEIKCAGGYPIWLCKLLEQNAVYPRSFSKYGNAYKRVLSESGAIRVQNSPAGKVSIARIPTTATRDGYDGALLQPSAGFEVPLISRQASYISAAV